MLARFQQLKLIQQKEEAQRKKISELTDKIESSIGTVSSDELVKMCSKRNDLNTELYFMGRQIENLKGRKGYLGDAISEVSETSYHKPK